MSEQQDTMTVDEIHDWLLGDDERYVEWRTDPANLRRVSEMVAEQAQKPGGLMTSKVNAKLRKERKRVRRKQAQEERNEARAAKLKDVAEKHFTSMGMSPTEFERRWKDLRAELLASGRAEELLGDAVKERRRKAARTF